MDTGTQQLYGCLLAALDPNPDTRKAAEAALGAGARQPGFGITLLNIMLLQEVPYGLRQLAAVVLKKHVKEHWTFESPHFREPPVEDGEKAQIREMLPAGLSDSNSKLRTATAMAIAGIAKWDCPQQWPNLLPGLVHSITAKKDINLGEDSNPGECQGAPHPPGQRSASTLPPALRLPLPALKRVPAHLLLLAPAALLASSSRCRCGSGACSSFCSRCCRACSGRPAWVWCVQ
jgi:hypothetical protein